jgi:hypothetical protein
MTLQERCRAYFSGDRSDSVLKTDLDKWGASGRLEDHGERTLTHLRRWAELKRDPFGNG